MSKNAKLSQTFPPAISAPSEPETRRRREELTPGLLFVSLAPAASPGKLSVKALRELANVADPSFRGSTKRLVINRQDFTLALEPSVAETYFYWK